MTTTTQDHRLTSHDQRSAARRFAAHYAEMVLAMLAGMLVLGMPLGAIPGDSDAQMLLMMGISMTAPMVAWMRHRGHAWRTCHEMAASMMLPTAGAIAVHATGLVDDLGAVMVGEHVVMLLAMAGVMLARPAEYLRCHGTAA